VFKGADYIFKKLEYSPTIGRPVGPSGIEFPLASDSRLLRVDDSNRYSPAENRDAARVTSWGKLGRETLLKSDW